MNLVNLDGLTLIGPGSEWFWAMLQLVVVAVSLVGLYRQVRLQSSASAIEQTRAITGEWNSEALHRSRLATLLSLRDGVDDATASRHAAIEVGNFWERVGWLVRSGKIDRKIIHAYVGTAVRLWWKLLAPSTEELRTQQQDVGVFEHFAWLATTIAEMDRRAGFSPDYDDEAFVRGLVRTSIDRSRGAIRLAEELRAVVVRPMSVEVGSAPEPATA